MRKTLLFKCFFVVLVIAVLACWTGAAFDDDESTNAPDCQPASLPIWNMVGALAELQAASGPELPQPLLREFSTHYLEMHEKSPPPSFRPF